MLQGWSVALSADGNTAVVGGFTDNGGQGAVWVYTRSGGIWTQQGDKLVGTGVEGYAGQGTSIALSADGNTVLVGGPYDSFLPDIGNAGAAWVFTRSAGVWTQQGPKLYGTGEVGNGEEGWSVALAADGNTAILGGPFDNTNIGAAWVFTRAATAPSLIAAVSRRVHGAAGAFDLPLSTVTTDPTTEPRQGPAHTIVFTFDRPITAATAAIAEGTATAATPTFSGNDVIVALTGVTDQQYVTISLTNVASADGLRGGTGSVRVGILCSET